MADPIPFPRSAAPRAPIAGSRAEHRPTHYRYARTQREAGIEDQEWEHRLPPPLRTGMFWLAVAASWAIFIGAAWWMVAISQGA